MNTREEKTLLIPFLVHGIINNKKLKTRYFIILKNSNMENTKKNFDIVWKEIMQDAEDLESYEFRKKRSKELEEGKNINTWDILWILRNMIQRFHDYREENKKLKEEVTELKADKQAIESYTYNLVNYLEDNDYEILAKEEIDNYIAWIQSYCN